LGLNDFNVPRERRDTFQGMFELFLDGFSHLMDKDISTQNIDEVEAKQEKPVEKKSHTQEIHVHVHTEAAIQKRVDEVTEPNKKK